MKKLIESKWQDILNILIKEHEISEVAVMTWIQPLTIASIDEDTITFYMEKGARGIDFIQHKYYDYYLSMTIEEVTGKQFKILFTDSLQPGRQTQEKIRKDARSSQETNLNPRYTFDTFVVGSTNKMAHAVSVAVAESPGNTSYNPLFLYGGAGLGKTHLMHSIGHYIMKTRPDLKVLYVTSEQFTNELIDALKHDQSIDFKNKYRSIDVLLIDDIQFIIGKISTQEEFFYTFNELYEAKKQIIISSDKHPNEISTLEERLRSLALQQEAHGARLDASAEAERLGSKHHVLPHETCIEVEAAVLRRTDTNQVRRPAKHILEARLARHRLGVFLLIDLAHVGYELVVLDDSDCPVLPVPRARRIDASLGYQLQLAVFHRFVQIFPDGPTCHDGVDDLVLRLYLCAHRAHAKHRHDAQKQSFHIAAKY